MIIPGLLFVFAISCKNDPKDIQSLLGKSNTQEDKAYDVTIIYSELGKVKARIYTKEFIKNDVAKPAFMDMKKGIKVEMFNDTMNVESTLTARYARYYEKQGNILLRDSIVVVNKKNEKLETEELVWNQQVKKFYTEKFVKITMPSQVMYGDGLEANEDFSWYEIKNPRGIVQVNKSELPN